ncbi:hypothetical protein [Winogradskya humida]|uniref:Uncharacterized protein n=1 Tax=Winogradskya humida TaxID=113566 RepID=A0ABQ3ZIR6_9ACTN|nr:hypothetical protein [Actinoplanes humidus]GIE18483.1 hypothetical protein Ahu01nite_015850 [Actinoplanes humidus]
MSHPLTNQQTWPPPYYQQQLDHQQQHPNPYPPYAFPPAVPGSAVPGSAVPGPTVSVPVVSGPPVSALVVSAPAVWGPAVSALTAWGPAASGPVALSAPASPSRPASAWLALGAGIAALIGTLLPWATVTAPLLGTMTATGTDGAAGAITAFLGLILVIYATLRLRNHDLPIPTDWLAGTAALGITALATTKIIALKHAEAALVPPATEPDPFGLTASLAASMHFSIGSGLWLLTAAGLTGTIAAAAAIITRTRTTP